MENKEPDLAAYAKKSEILEKNEDWEPEQIITEPVTSHSIENVDPEALEPEISKEFGKIEKESLISERKNPVEPVLGEQIVEPEVESAVISETIVQENVKNVPGEKVEIDDETFEFNIEDLQKELDNSEEPT